MNMKHDENRKEQKKNVKWSEFIETSIFVHIIFGTSFKILHLKISNSIDSIIRIFPL